MRIIVQKCLSANVSIGGKVYNEIKNGLVLLVGFTYNDSKKEIDYMVNKVKNLRIFDDNNGVMNLSVSDTGGEILSISQFTLYGDARKGNRPSYVKALNGKEASVLYDLFNASLKESGLTVKTGVFGSDMKVSLINDGPTTIILEKENQNE